MSGGNKKVPPGLSGLFCDNHKALHGVGSTMNLKFFMTAVLSKISDFGHILNLLISDLMN